ncbi:MAG: DUF2959 family protein [Planctomycetota bacterium]
MLSLLAACVGTTEKAASVQRVDDLLAHVESVQVDAVVSKEMTHGALDQLDAICSPSFAGDAKESYAQLLDRIESSEKQARQLRASIEPMRLSAESVFRQWTADLEAFGSTRMRQRSQMRLDETQARYRTVQATAQSALISYDAFNGDLRDHALFLSHDMNVSAVTELAGDLKLMRDVLIELDARLDACASAARAYVESAALYGQIEAPGAEGATEEPTQEMPAQEPASNGATGTKRRASTLKKNTVHPVQPAPSTAPQGPPAPATEGTEPSAIPPVHPGQRSR